MSTAIKLEGITKKYGDKTIISDLSLQIEGGEFFTLLGPSGCGKTTLLRMIAGFNSIEGGSIYFNDREINNIPPYRRNIGMVFQNYAIFPHMSVRRNIEYGLYQRKEKKDEIGRRVREIMEIVKISEHMEKSPSQLSGGQQQRVALARAIVIHPTVLLMDEPLSNIDAKLRVEMRGAIREIQKSVGITTVYVTHDQEEALAVSDRIAVMNNGRLMQVGTPEALYRRPANVFVASFVGTSNLFDGLCRITPAGPALALEGQEPVVVAGLRAGEGEKVKAAIRPEEFTLTSAGPGLRGIIRSRVFLGRYVTYTVELERGGMAEVTEDSREAGPARYGGDAVFLRFDPRRVNVFDAGGERGLIGEEQP
ncbi:MAG: ABC transporter ATP-binding protein [Treponema sp.]|jgi:iron(III) transport system ATP-binding protein|nr:ABC transporter ATP-binding protein [Treponema sp.]